MVALVLVFPLLGIGLNLVIYRSPLMAGIIATVAAGSAFVVSACQFLGLLANPQPVILTLAEWIHVGSFSVDWTLYIDRLAVTMLLLVSGVATLVHVYALGYMQADPRFRRFFIYLNLFLAAMLVLVTASNYLMLFAGWEGVGLCSFLLIGFWFDKPGEGAQISSAARKAFVVNRIGDAGLLAALLLIATTFGTLDFARVSTAARATFAVGTPLLTLITLLLFVGVTAKSAQIPLYVWLPDAMVGPTPVSALIHAATMVTAGVYLIVRAHVLFDLAPLVQAVITLTGAATALLAASIAISQFDIKRVLAYSTISQLGFMIAAVGLGAYTAGIFHLITHAFFKALLFLAAGSILHALGTQDARQLGGLRRMPITCAAYLAGALALAGLPPFSGFFSKDEILAAAYARSPALYLLLAAVGFLTAFYIARQCFLIFAGSPRSDAARHPHESKPLLTYPLLALALLAAVGGLLNLPGSPFLHEWLSGVTGEAEAAAPFNLPLALLSTLIALAGIALAYRLYHAYRASDPLAGRLFDESSQGWRIDALYNALFVKPFRHLADRSAAADNRFSYGLDRAAVRLANTAADRLRSLQTGQVNWNIVGIVSGLILVLLIVIVEGGL